VSLIRLQDGKAIVQAGKVGTGAACCCGGCHPCCTEVTWTYTRGGCTNTDPQITVNLVFLTGEGEYAQQCYSYFTDEDYDCQNELVGRDCGAGEQCNIYARVKVTCPPLGEGETCSNECTLSAIEYQNIFTGEWGADPLVNCDCPSAFGSLTAELCPTPPVECDGVGFGTGWFTAGGQADLVALLEAAGYTDVIFSPREPYLGSGLPFTDGCGQTFYAVSASCCGTTIGCDPVFTSGFVSGIAGPGNQNPPCGEATSDESFIETCCENPLP
jgi:hypothetical protein